MLLRRNCPSQMERENRQHGNEKGCKETREEGRKEEKAVTILQTEHNGDAQASPNLLCRALFRGAAGIGINWS